MVEPLIPFDFYARFIKVGLNKGDNRVSQMKELVDKLPKENYGQFVAHCNVAVEGKSERACVHAEQRRSGFVRKLNDEFSHSCRDLLRFLFSVVRSDAVTPVRFPLRGCRALGQQQDGAG